MLTNVIQSSGGAKQKVKSEFDPQQVNYDDQQKQKVVKIQSHIRGRQIRKQAKQGKFYSSKNAKPIYLYVEFFSDEEGLEFREEVVFPDGTVYKGQMKDGQRHGFGIQVWPDGARYEGSWRNNVASGKGRFFHTDGDVYEGKK